MPLYEYQCESCQHRFEKIQKFSDPLVTVCPVCGGLVRKLFSSPAIQFKGSGWYITDYAKKSSTENSKGSGSSESQDSTDSKDKADASKSDTAKSDTAKSDTGSTSEPAKTETKTKTKTKTE
jgi:putative FmdB family regulatory protein